MKITTERGVLFTTASGKSILRWNGGKPPTDDGFNKLQVFIDNTVVRHMDPYVTMRTGMLKKSVILGSRMGSGELVFIAPYAHKQYYRNGKLKGKRGSRWFHRMWAALKDTIVREVKNYARRLIPLNQLWTAFANTFPGVRCSTRNFRSTLIMWTITTATVWLRFRMHLIARTFSATVSTR